MEWIPLQLRRPWYFVLRFSWPRVKELYTVDSTAPERSRFLEPTRFCRCWFLVAEMRWRGRGGGRKGAERFPRR